MENTYFSIIIPSLNEESTLPNLLQNLKDQTYQDFEVIIVDAKSKDKTKQNALKFKDSFKKFTFIETHKKGAARQRNLGAKNSSSNWIVFTDADNQIPNYFLQGLKYKQELLNPDILSTWIAPDSNNRNDKAAATVINLIIDTQKNTKSSYILESMLLVKKSVFKSVGGFDESISWGEGSDFMRRAQKKGFKFTFTKDPKYTFSFRRFRKTGAFKMFRSVAQIELTRFANSELSKKISKKLYPMEGGKYFEVKDKQLNNLKTILLKIIKNGSKDFKPNLKLRFRTYLTKLFQNK